MAGAKASQPESSYGAWMKFLATSKMIPTVQASSARYAKPASSEIGLLP